MNKIIRHLWKINTIKNRISLIKKTLKALKALTKVHLYNNKFPKIKIKRIKVKNKENREKRDKSNHKWSTIIYNIIKVKNPHREALKIYPKIESKK